MTASYKGLWNHGVVYEVVPWETMLSLVASAGLWLEHLHPRGKDGKFIKKFGIVKFLSGLTGGWEYGQVVGMDKPDSGSWQSGSPKIIVRPSDLSGKPSGKPDLTLPTSKLYSAPTAKAKIDLSSLKKVGGQAGSNPGGLYETAKPQVPAVTHLAGSDLQKSDSTEKYPAGQAIKVTTPSGVTYEGKLKYTALGVGASNNKAPLVDTKEHGPIKIFGDWEVEFQDTGADPESSPMYYIKTPKSVKHGQNEALANLLYAEAGTPVPEVTYDQEADAIFSKIVPGDQNATSKLKDPTWLKHMQENFVVDAWLGNWDVVGMTWDNIMTTPEGVPYRIDNGGSMLYRAMGEPKGKDFGSTVSELKGMKTGKKAAVFGDAVMDKEAELDGAKRVLAISPEHIEELVAEHNLPKSLADTLKARRQYIANYYNLPLPETVQPPGSDYPTSAPLIDPSDDVHGGGMPRTWSRQVSDLFSLASVAEAGDKIKTSKGTSTLGHLDVSGEPIDVFSHLSALQGEGGPFQIQKAKAGPRIEHNATVSNAPSAAALLADAEWQRGDRITVDGQLLNVIGVNRANKVMVVAPVQTDGSTEAPKPFMVNLLNLPGPVQTHRWNPEITQVPEPVGKTGMDAEAEKAIKADLVSPLPDAGPPPAPKPEAPVAKPGDGIGEPSKGNPKSMHLGDGTLAETGDTVYGKKDGKSWVYVKPKGQFAIVYDPNDPDKKYKQKLASTLAQPNKSADPNAPTAEKPKTADGTVPAVGMIGQAKDGKTGEITMVSPDGSFVYIQTPDGKKYKKSTGTVTITEKSAEAVDTNPPTVEPGAPALAQGFASSNYGVAPTGAGAYDFGAGDTEDTSVGDVNHLTTTDAIWVQYASGQIGIEPYNNQPPASIIKMENGNIPLFSVGGLKATDGSFTSTADKLPPLNSAQSASYYALVGDKEVYFAPDNIDLSSGLVYSFTKDNKGYTFSTNTPIIVKGSGYDPTGTFVDSVSYLPGPDATTKSGDMVDTLSLFQQGKLKAGSSISFDGEHWHEVTWVGQKSKKLVLKDGGSFNPALAPHVYVFHKSAESVDPPETSNNPEVPGEPKAELTTADNMFHGQFIQTYWGTAILSAKPGEPKTVTTPSGATKTGSASLLAYPDGSYPDVSVSTLASFIKNEDGDLAAGVTIDGDLYSVSYLETSPEGDKLVLSGLSGEKTINVSYVPVGEQQSPEDAGPLLKVTLSPKTEGGPSLLKKATTLNETPLVAQPPTAVEVDTPESGKTAANVVGLPPAYLKHAPTDIYHSAGSYYRWGNAGSWQKYDAGADAWQNIPDTEMPPNNELSVIASVDNSEAMEVVAPADSFITPGTVLKAPVDKKVDLVTVNGTAYVGFGNVGQYYLAFPDGTWNHVAYTGTPDKPVENLWDPWSGDKASLSVGSGGAEGAPVFSVGSTVIKPAPNELVIEMKNGGTTAYVVQPGKGSDAQFYGNGYETTLPDASIDHVLSGKSTYGDSKIVYKGPDWDPDAAGEVSTEEKKFFIGTHEVPAGSSIYKSDIGWYTYQAPGTDSWVVMDPDGENHGTSSVFPESSTLTHVQGPEASPSAPTPPPTFFGYTPQPGEAIWDNEINTYKLAVSQDGSKYKYIYTSGDVSQEYPMSPGVKSVMDTGWTNVWPLNSPQPNPETATAAVAPKKFTDSTPYVLTDEFGNDTNQALDGYHSSNLEKITDKFPPPAGTQVWVSPNYKGSAWYIHGDGTSDVYGMAGATPVQTSSIWTAEEVTSGDYAFYKLVYGDGSNTPAPAVAATPVPESSLKPVSDLSALTEGTVIKVGIADSWFKVKKSTGNPNGAKVDISHSWVDGKWVEADFHYFLYDTSGVESPDAPDAAPIPAAPTTPSPAEEAAAWGGDLLKSGEIPKSGMQVTGKGPMSGVILSVSKDKTKAVVLTDDGKKTTRLISALSYNPIGQVSLLGPVTSVDIPETEVLPSAKSVKEAMAELFAKEKSHIVGLPNMHQGIVKGYSAASNAVAPSGKKYVRVVMTLTKEQRKKLRDLLSAGPKEPEKLGDWSHKQGLLSDVVVGDRLSLRHSTTKGAYLPAKSVNLSTDHGNYVLLAKGEPKDGMISLTFHDDDDDTSPPITQDFPLKTSTGADYMVYTHAWDPTKPAPKKASAAGDKITVSDAAKAAGWSKVSDGLWSGFQEDGSGINKLLVEPGSTVGSSSKAKYKSGTSGAESNAVRAKLADGTVIEVGDISAGSGKSTSGMTVISIPEGGEPEKAYAAALSTLGMTYTPTTQESAKAQALILVRTMVNSDYNNIDTLKGMSEAQIWAKAAQASGISDIGWGDVLMRMDPTSGVPEFYWSDRVREALVKKNKWNVVQRGGSTGTADRVVSVLKYGSPSSALRMVAGLGGGGISSGTDNGYGTGAGSYMSAGGVSSLSKHNSLGMGGGGMMVYHQPAAFLGRIMNLQGASHDAFGKGEPGSNAMASFAGGSLSHGASDLYVDGGMGAEHIGFIAVQSGLERQKAIDAAKAQGITHIKGRPIEEVIKTFNEIVKLSPKDMPEWKPPEDLVPILDLPSINDVVVP